MPEISYEWLDRDSHLLLVHYPLHYTWDDYHRNLDKLAADIADDDSKLYIINQYDKGTRLPPNIISPHWKRSVRTLNIAYLVYVTEDAVLMSMVRNFLAMVNFHWKENFDFAPNLEEAQEKMSVIMAKQD